MKRAIKYFSDYHFKKHNMKFTTPVSMPVTEAQYNELKPLLEAMGYEVYNFRGNGTIVSFQNLSNIENFDNADIDGLIKLPTYHRDLFLALAAMTDEPNGIAGEWWKCLYKAAAFAEGKIYKSFRPLQRQEDFVYDDDGQQSGIFTNDKNFTKASISEIFAHFGVSAGKDQADTPIEDYKAIEDVMNQFNNTSTPQPTPFQGIDRRTYLAGCIAGGCIADGGPFDPKHWVNMTDKLISELDKTK